ncbi:phage tail sheath subtilisin-like domain-containing protein [Clostridium tyrobutyricum]|uniref:phage tail sheath subtilisin-like domain-containing protein n=1 Tax=Clostridium tyrobutyricum TaxID=1519 RepID=UPI002B2204CA|nr:phage tail sheath subtilisin-like domain-containing protein [Clostridium tyrobutyricum]MEA5008231.1 phage tail sheath C-terminal domain-containing protein [Clostridium tyrobutyricum]
MGLPSTNIVFRQQASTAIQRGNKGIAVLILEEATVPEVNPVIMSGNEDIPKTLTDENKEQISLAFIGYTNPPKKVIAYIVPKPVAGEGGTIPPVDYSEAQHYLETILWDYIAVPEIEDSAVINFASWIKSLRDTKKIKVKAVLPNCPGDHEGIINYCNESNKQQDKEYTAKQYCSRIAGLLAGTPLNSSATYAPLSELVDCDHLTKEEADEAIDAGKLILINDGKKVKIGRAVNSLVTLPDGKGKSYKKIKVIDVMDQEYRDIKETIEDSYTGKVDNDYDHKILLINAIRGYFSELEMQGLLNRGSSDVSMNIVAQKQYLKDENYKTPDGRGLDDMTEQEIKEANTDEKVFMSGSQKIIDVMEDIEFDIEI